ncbi:MAG: hypothetical protein ACRD44_11850 [Bryobacteraceae bacterium]
MWNECRRGRRQQVRARARTGTCRRAPFLPLADELQNLGDDEGAELLRIIVSGRDEEIPVRADAVVQGDSFEHRLLTPAHLAPQLVSTFRVARGASRSLSILWPGAGRESGNTS